MCSSGNSGSSFDDFPLPFHKYFVPVADQIILMLFSVKTALQSWPSVNLCYYVAWIRIQHKGSMKWTEKCYNYQYWTFSAFPAESQFFEPPGEKQIASNCQEVWKIGGKITVFDSWREVLFDSNYQGFRKPKSSRNQDSIVYYWVCQQQWWQLRKCHWKSEFVLPQTLSRLSHLFQLNKRWHFFWSWILKDCFMHLCLCPVSFLSNKYLNMHV